LDLDLRVIAWPLPLFFLSSSSICSIFFCFGVIWERQVLALFLVFLHCPCIVLSSPLRLVRVRDHEHGILGGWTLSRLGGWCYGDLRY
jgi:hypothetical protein